MIVGGLCAIAVVTGIAVGRTAGAQGSQAPLRVAVVNLATAVKDCAALSELTTRTRDALDADWKEKIANAESDLETKQERYEERRRASDDASSLETERMEIEIAEQRLKLAKEARDASRQVSVFQNTLEVMALANLAIRDVAVRDGVHIVFKTIDLKGVAADGQEQGSGLAQLQAFRQSVEGNTVLYYNGPSPSGEYGRIDDITQQVADLLRAWKYDDKRDAIRREMGVNKLRDE